MEGREGNRRTRGYTGNGAPDRGGEGVEVRYQGEGYPSGRADGRPGKVGERKYSLIPKGLENIKVKILFIIINCY